MIKSHKDGIKEKSIDLHRYYPDKYKKNTYSNYNDKYNFINAKYFLRKKLKTQY